MSDSTVYFEGDPETDSARRHMERVLKGEEAPRRRWPWMMAALGGGSLWLIWQAGRAAANTAGNPRDPRDTPGQTRLPRNPQEALK